MAVNNKNTEHPQSDNIARREVLGRMGDALRCTALSTLLAGTANTFYSRDLQGSSLAMTDSNDSRRIRSPKAKTVIHFFMNGGPSQVDLFDPKPALKRFEGSPPTKDIAAEIEFTNESGTMMPSPFRFSRYGDSGMELSELLPGLREVSDEICLVRSMHGEHFNHEPSLYLMQTGRTIPGRPAVGSWVVYGLGSENQNLPSYVVLDDPKGLPINGIQNWSSGWMPPVFQGTRLRSEGPPLLNLSSDQSLPEGVQSLRRDFLRQLDASHRQRHRNYPELDARIASFELAARMQLAAPEALDISRETAATHEMYGLNNDDTRSYGKRCLMARRLVERGVRFIQIYIESQIWDSHSNLVDSLKYACKKTDHPISGLIKDLKQRGLLDTTLLLWGGEFGRLPIAQVSSSRKGGAGRDHGPSGFSVWLAGGGVRGGYVHGATDEIGHKAVDQRVSVHDLHATVLNLLGMDARDLVYRRHGLDERLTDQYPARVISEMLL